MTYFLAGLGIGAFVALAGGLIEYVLHLRRGQMPRSSVPGCLVYAVGGLVLAGIVAIAASFVLTGGIGPALYMGVGVMSGFYGGFILLVSLWLLLESIRTADDDPEPSPPQSP